MFVRLMVLSVLITGCKKKEPEVATPAPRAAAARAPIISPVNFETGSTTISSAEEGAIDEAARILKTTDWTVLVLGLADATGDADKNKILSEERAEAVANALRAKTDVPSSRIQVHAIGERLATGGSEVAERKVEFVFFEDEGLPLREVVVRSRVLEADFRAKRQ